MAVIDDPFDHNAECTFCDEQGMHTADCPWIEQLVAEVERLQAEVARLTDEISQRAVDAEWNADRHDDES
jgi:hypothetical protein